MTEHKMTDINEVWQQINQLENKYIFWTKKEIKHLPEILIAGEKILALTSGFSNSHTVLAICTNRRMLFLDKGMIFGLRQWQMALDRIQSIDGNYGLFFGGLRVWDGAAPMSMNLVLASTIDPFIKTTRQAIDDFRRLNFQETIGKPGTDLASQLERLAKLYDSGHLTQEEFEAQKQKLL